MKQVPVINFTILMKLLELAYSSARRNKVKPKINNFGYQSDQQGPLRGVFPLRV